MKVIVTRNFKQEVAPAAKYCVARFGARPEKAKEAESVVVEKVRFAETYDNLKTQGFANFGCGVVAIGETSLVTFKAKGVPIEFNGSGFVTKDGRSVKGAAWVRFGPNAIVAYKPDYYN